MNSFSIEQPDESISATRNDDDDDNNNNKSSSPYLTREFITFFLIGILNNSTYVIMNAGAKEIAPSAVGFVYVCNVAPSFITKLTGPYWFHKVSYKKRFQIAAICMIIAFLIVALGQVVNSKILQFLGIAIISFQSGLGEASFLALSAFYNDSRLVLTGWSSGTGIAGIFGYAWVSILVYGMNFSFAACLLLANILPLVWYIVIFKYLPWPSNINRDNTTTTNNKNHLDQQDTLLDKSYTLSDEIESLNDISNDNNDNKDRNGNDKVDLSKAASTMSTMERLHNTMKLWKYMIPLFLVYFAEYATQSGTWAAIGFPITSKTARNTFYEYANFTYQIGVFFSRSSGLYIKSNLKMIWILPFIQIALMFFFILDAYYMFWYDWTLLLPSFIVGLIGGAVYVGAFALIAEDVEEDKREFSLSAASIADSIGILFSNICGVWIQKGLYEYHGISD